MRIAWGCAAVLAACGAAGDSAAAAVPGGDPVVRIVCGRRLERCVTAPRTSVDRPIDVAWDPIGGGVVVARRDPAADHDIVGRWDARGRPVTEWRLPEGVHVGGVLHRVRGELRAAGWRRDPPGAPASGWPPRGSGFCLLRLPGRGAAAAVGILHIWYDRELDADRARALEAAFALSGWSLPFGGLAYEQSGAGYGVPVSSLDFNSRDAAFPMAWTADRRSLTAGSWYGEGVWLRAPQGRAYVTRDVGEQVFGAVRAVAAPGSALRLTGAWIGPGAAAYGLEAEAGGARQWYVVRMNLRSAPWSVTSVEPGLLAHQLETFVQRAAPPARAYNPPPDEGLEPGGVTVTCPAGSLRAAVEALVRAAGVRLRIEPDAAAALMDARPRMRFDHAPLEGALRALLADPDRARPVRAVFRRVRGCVVIAPALATVRLCDTPVDEALERVFRAAGVDFAICAGALPARRVTLRVERACAADAAAAVLRAVGAADRFEVREAGGVVAVAIVGQSAANPAAGRVTYRFRRVPVRWCVRALCVAAGVDYVIDAGISGPARSVGRRVPLGRALRAVLGRDLTVRVEEGVHCILPRADLVP